MPEAIMRDPHSAMAAGLQMPTREGCVTCHQEKSFDFDAAMKKIAHPTKPPKAAQDPRYKTRCAWPCGPMGVRSTSPVKLPIP